MTNHYHRARNARDRGFTLIELLVVVIIIGILAAIAIPVFLNQRKKAVDAAMKSDVKNAALAVETWMIDNPGAAVPSTLLPPTDPGGTGAAGTPLEGFKASPNNRITAHPNSTTVGAYCITASNVGASVWNSTAARLKYDSAAGGIQPGAHGFDCD